MNNTKTITIFGGNGFLGKHLVKNLLHHDYNLQIISRYVQPNQGYKEYTESGRLKFIQGDITSSASIDSALTDNYAVINLVGILFEKKCGDFVNIHTKAAATIASLAKKHQVKKLIHVSALGVDKATTSVYAQSKLNGEQEVLKNFPDSVIIRPSIIFGPEDNFYNQFANMARFSPFLPLIGGGNTKFQPVFVDDVAEAILKTLQVDDYNGKIIELGGPEIYSFKQILEYILTTIKKKRILLPLSFPLASLMGMVAQILPKPPITHDQVILLKFDNVVSGKHIGFNELNIIAKHVDEIVPKYL